MPEVRRVEDIAELIIDGDLIHVLMQKEFTYESVVAYFQILDEVRARNKLLFLLCSGEQYTSFPEERVRAYVAKWTAKNTFSGMAVYGLNPILRPLFGLLVRAFNLLKPGSGPTVFVKDEAAGRQWIEERRALLAAAERSAKRGP